ncbi:MAG: FAM83 family protein [Gemmataceae bacterium]|nr:FAM83 family protein [Gemmataceae bacterium]
MTMQEWERWLRASLADRRVSASERAALGQFPAPDAQQEGAMRAKLFDVAAEEAADPRVRELLGWVADVLKAMAPKPTRVAATEALFSPQDSIAGRLAALIDGAKRSVEACVFTITDDRLADALVRAHRRGAAVRLVTDDDKAHDLGADIGRLRHEGIEVRMDRSEAHMHHKFALFDGATLATGSYNWTRSAQGWNNENLIVTADAKLVEAFAREFARLWERWG